MIKLLTPVLALTMLLGATSGAQAAPITYNVNLSIGDGSATGSITTNGSLGILGAGNIIDWDLLLNDGVTTFTLDGLSNSARSLIGSGLVATLSALTFNFSGSGYLIFQNPNTGSGINYLWIAGVDQGADQGLNLATTTYGSDRTGMTGVQIIGTAAVTPVPEPASLLLLGTGLAGMGVRRWKQRRA